MATYSRFECSSCGLEIDQSGPHLFYRNQDQSICYLPHPASEPFDHRIEGMIFQKYCSRCGESRRFIYDESENDNMVHDEMDFLIGKLKEDRLASVKRTPYCEYCGGNEFIHFKSDSYDYFSQDENDFSENFPQSETVIHECPRCHEMALRLTDEIMT